MRIVSELSSMSRLSFASRLLGHPKGIALARDDEEIAHQLAQHGIILLSVIESPGLVAKFLCPAVACLVRQQVNIRRLPLQLPQGFVATDVCVSALFCSLTATLLSPRRRCLHC